MYAGDGAQVRYRLPWAALQGHRPGPQRSIELHLSASEFRDKVPLLKPPPRKHRHRYFGGLAPNSPRREQLLARIYGVFALECSRCGGRVRMVAFITKQAMVRRILAHVGSPTTAPATAPARSPPVEANRQQLIGPEAVEAIPELEFDQTANLASEAGHGRLAAGVGADAEPTPELEIDQTLGR